MRRRKAGNRPTLTPTGSPQGRKVQSDARDLFAPSPRGRSHPQTPSGSAGTPNATPRRTTLFHQKRKFDQMIATQPWRSHQSAATICEKEGGHCNCKNCPGERLSKAERPRGCKTTHRCHQCSIEQRKTVWLCNTLKTRRDSSGNETPGERMAVLCHMKHHTEMSKHSTNDETIQSSQWTFTTTLMTIRSNQSHSGDIGIWKKN